jgi:hypothetical protein
MEEKIKSKLKYLNEMLEKYNELNRKTKNRYDWRGNAINDQIEALEDILENRPNNQWNECYEEDLKESNIY